MKSIKTKLVIYFSILILLLTAALGFVAVNRASTSLAKEAERSLTSMAQEAAKLTESRVEIQKKTLQMLALREDIQSMDWAIQQPILQNQLKNTNYLALAVVQPDGTALYSDGSTSQLGDRAYVKKAFGGQVNVSDLLLSKVTNTVVLMYAAPIEKDGKVVGVLIGRSDGNALSTTTDDMGYGDAGYAYMINGKGTVVAHPDREKVLKQFNPIEEAKKDESLKSVAVQFERIIKEKAGISQYLYKGNTTYAGYSPVKGTDWIIVITANKSEVLAAVPAMQTNILILGIIILLVSIAFTYFIGNSISKPIVETVKYSVKIANLDITQDVPEKFLKNKDETGMLAKSLQSIIDSLRTIIKDISASSEQLAASSEELTATSQQSALSAEEVSKTVEEIAKAASDQARNTENGSYKATVLGEVIEKDQNHLADLNFATDKVAEVVNEGLKEIDNLSQITKESNSATKEIYEVILKTNDSSNNISQASNVIASIAEQTNLLALNAAIEAARAGDAGRGFAVVAEEIRKLAEQSTTSTKSIDKIVNELQYNAHEAVKTMERVYAITEEQTSSVTDNRDKYLLIKESMSDAVKAVEHLNASSAEMNKVKNEILDTLQNLSAIAEENSAATQQATASMEEQSASIEEIADASESLSNLAQQLQSIITKFKI